MHEICDFRLWHLVARPQELKIKCFTMQFNFAIFTNPVIAKLNTTQTISNTVVRKYQIFARILLMRSLQGFLPMQKSCAINTNTFSMCTLGNDRHPTMSVMAGPYKFFKRQSLPNTVQAMHS